jgi:hypothetical protein
MDKDSYVKLVKSRMNEVGWDDGYSGVLPGGDVSKVGRAVELTFVDAWRHAVSEFPKDYFVTSSFVGMPHVYDVSEGTGFVVLPSDYYVLKQFGMEGWRKPCYIAVEETDAVSVLEANRYVRGNYVRPVCVLSEHSGYGRVLRYYSLPRGMKHVVSVALYVPLTGGIEGLGGSADLSLDGRLYGPLSWLNAGYVFSMFGGVDMAKVCEDRALSI